MFDEQLENELLGYDCLEMTPDASLYAVPGLSVVISRQTIHFPAGQHAHSEYEFIIPGQDLPTSLDDGRQIVAGAGKITPLNSWQKHGVAAPTRMETMTAVLCRRTFLESVARRAFGHADIVFENVSCDIGNRLSYLLGQLVDENIAQQPGYQAMQDSLSVMLVTEIIRQTENNVTAASGARENGQERQGIARAVSFLRDRYMNAISVEDAAAAAGMSQAHFSRAFRRFTGKSPHVFLTDVRIEQAAQLLQQRHLSVTEVALACGFASPAHFSTVFRRRMGVSPSDYRRMLLY
ncbi:MAG: helix-turn-helix domain-containing protein [Bacillota bacterium]|jgi:AraC family transcriptional regulator